MSGATSGDESGTESDDKGTGGQLLFVCNAKSVARAVKRGQAYQKARTYAHTTTHYMGYE
jgi:hypothetical protein